MPWFYVDDQFAHSKPVMAMPDRYRLGACGLWVLGGSWSAREKTDGRISRNMLRQLLGNTRQPLREVLKATDGTYEPLWVDGEDGGDQVNQWGKWQPFAEQLRSERESNAKRMREWREQNPDRAKSQTSRKRRGRNGLTSIDGGMLRVTEPVTRRAAANSRNGVRTPPPDPDPLVVTTGGGVTEGDTRVAAPDFPRNGRPGSPTSPGADAPPPPPTTASGNPASADALPEPPPPCPHHPKPDHPDPCRACQAVRVWRDSEGLRVQQEAAQRRIERDQAERRRAAAIRRCDMCDVTGEHRRANLRVVCPHDPDELQRVVAQAQRTVAAHQQRNQQPQHAGITTW